MSNNKQQRRKQRQEHAAPATPEQRKMFWEMVSRKGGIHIRF